MEQSGKIRKELAQSYLKPEASDITVCRWRKLAVVTCVALSPDDRLVHCGTKDNNIITWTVDGGKMVHVIPAQKKDSKSDKPTGHTDHVLAIAVSSDGKYLVSGSRDKMVHVWNHETYRLVHTFLGHKAAVSGLVFQKGTHQLFSCSEDRSVKVWNLDEMAYVETLFGHEVGITGVDCLAQERIVTSGGRDNSVRLWKIVDESHLVFHGHSSSIDCVCYIDDQHFFSGAEDNSLAIWGTMKKKPLMTVKDAHPGPSDTDKSAVKCWITAVAALPHTDLLVSGSSDGMLRFWECGRECKIIRPLFTLPLEGYVNSLRFSSDGQFLLAGVGREHRLGRWHSLKHVKDFVCIIRLRKKPNVRT
jgi:ribosomal RNA-processing protein 9